jgi:hypothetical protein
MFLSPGVTALRARQKFFPLLLPCLTGYYSLPVEKRRRAALELPAPET